jgi:hypothetical protein
LTEESTTILGGKIVKIVQSRNDDDSGRKDRENRSVGNPWRFREEGSWNRSLKKSIATLREKKPLECSTEEAITSVGEKPLKCLSEHSLAITGEELVKIVQSRIDDDSGRKDRENRSVKKSMTIPGGKIVKIVR